MNVILWLRRALGSGYEEPFVTDGSIHVTSAGMPKKQIIPVVGGVSRSEKTLIADTAGNASAQLIEIRATVNPADSIVAANRLMNAYPDVIAVYPGESVMITSLEPITAITLIGIADVIGTPDGVAKLSSSVLSDFTSQQIEYEFNSADKVHVVELSLSDLFDSGRSAQQRIAGYAS